MTTITISREPASGWNGAALLGWYTFWKNLTNPFSIGFAILLPIGMYFMFGTGQSYSDIWTVNGNVAATVLVSMTLYGVFMRIKPVFQLQQEKTHFVIRRNVCVVIRHIGFFIR